MIAVIMNTSFFFSSRSRHTTSTRDWSSDVCSSDLSGGPARGEHLVSGHEPAPTRLAAGGRRGAGPGGVGRGSAAVWAAQLGGAELQASETRVGLGGFPGAGGLGDPAAWGVGLLRLLFLLVGPAPQPERTGNYTAGTRARKPGGTARRRPRTAPSRPAGRGGGGGKKESRQRPPPRRAANQRS